MESNYDQIQQVELSTWNIEDPIKRREKAQRESVRYPMIAKNMGLNYLDTSWMTVYDIGAGPLGGVSSVINCYDRTCFDPLRNEYAKYFDVFHYENEKGEDLKERLSIPDLIIITNALDHFEDPIGFMQDLKTYTKPGTFFAHAHAIDNAVTHPHEAHQHNINPEWMNYFLNSDFELCWNYDFKNDGARYGWTPYNGTVGQPAFYQLWRKTTGYETG